MGMTIDEAERYLRLMLGGMKYAVSYWKDRDKEEADIEQTNVEAVETALDTMRKYQKIEQDIVKPVLDKIRAEIEKQEKWLLQAGYNTYNVDIAFNSIKLALAESEDREND